MDPRPLCLCSVVFCCDVFFFLLSLMAYFGQTAEGPILLCVHVYRGE